MLSSERNKLIEENMGLVGKVIKDKVSGIKDIGIFTYEDLFQIGCIGLCYAADSFKPGRGRFSTYAYILIRNEIFDALDYATVRRTRDRFTDFNRHPMRCVPGPISDSEYGIDSILAAALEQTAGVTAKGIKAIRMLADGYTHREIGELMGGVSANNVSAWVARARKYLRAQPEIAALGEFI
jgi:RNA polymerase sigma factor (sigma-70 family)